MTKLDRVLHAFESRPWAMYEPKLNEILGFIEHRLTAGKLSRREIQAATRAKPQQSRSAAVAVVPLFGCLSQRMDFMAEYSGGTSTQAFASSIRALADDVQISAIVIDADSPGGSVDAGLVEAAEAVAYAASQKTVIAVANSMMCSAAYWVCSGATEIVGAPLSTIGSIGVFSVHTEYSKAEAKAGIKATVVRAGRFKAEDNPHEPLSDEAHDHKLAMAETAYAQFVGAVSKNRGVKAEDVRAGFGEGLALLAEQAQGTGLIDRIAMLDEVIGDLASGSTTKRRALAAAAPNEQLATSLSPDQLRSLVHESVSRALNANASGFTPPVILTTNTTAAAQDPAEELEEDTCPECGKPMEDGECADCKDKETGDSEGAPAAAAASAPAPLQSAQEAKEVTMAESNAAAATETPGAESVKLAERKRGAELNGLRGTLGVTDKQIDAWIADGTSYEAAAAHIVNSQKAAAGGLPPVASGRARVTEINNRAENDPRRGFANHREFLLAAIDNAGLRDRSVVSDERLRPLAVVANDGEAAKGELAFMLPAAFTPRGLSATVGSDEQGGYADRFGGFAVPTQVLPGLLSIPFEGDPTVGRTQAIPMGAPLVKINARTDKDHSSSVSGGFTVSRKPETAAAAATRSEIEQVELKASSLFGLAFATEEILADSPISFAAIIASGFADQFPAHLLNEKIRGTGASEYLGFLNSPAKVSVAKETNQVADTINFDNIVKMAARCWGFGQAIWLANHDTRPQLAKIALPIGTAGVAMYQPSPGEGFPDMLWGRPVFYSEYCGTIGDEGDLILVNCSQYLEGVYQPLQSAESVHVRFLNHERAFKFWTRNAGAPWWRAALTPAKSAVTLSPIVTLAAR